MSGIMHNMSEVQDALTKLQEGGWSLTAIAGELNVTVNAVEKWKAGQRNPSNPTLTLQALGNLAKRKRVPKRRRHHREKPNDSR